MKKNFLILLSLISVLIGQSQELVQDASKTSVTFKIENWGVDVHGVFTDITFKSNFDGNNLANAYINAFVQVKTIDTDNSTRNKSLLKQEYFDEANYPTIILKSVSFEKTSENKYILTAQLTIKGTTKTVTIPFSISKNGNEIIMSSTFEVNRRDYKVGKSSWVLADEVEIKVNYVATK